jgi:hypothetical protein
MRAIELRGVQRVSELAGLDDDFERSVRPRARTEHDQSGLVRRRLSRQSRRNSSSTSTQAPNSSMHSTRMSSCSFTRRYLCRMFSSISRTPSASSRCRRRVTNSAASAHSDRPRSACHALRSPRDSFAVTLTRRVRGTRWGSAGGVGPPLFRRRDTMRVRQAAKCPGLWTLGRAPDRNLVLYRTGDKRPRT